MFKEYCYRTYITIWINPGILPSANMIIQELPLNDHQCNNNSVKEGLEIVNEGEEYIYSLWMLDAHFLLDLSINKNVVTGPIKFLLSYTCIHCTIKRLLCNVKCHLIAQYTIFFLKNYRQIHKGAENSWFQQDGLTMCTAQISMAAVHQLFGNHIILRNGN